MRFYQVNLTHDAGVSAGFQWFTTRRAADEAAREWVNDPERETAEVQAVDIIPTKKGILSALNIHASHPDNG